MMVFLHCFQLYSLHASHECFKNKNEMYRMEQMEYGYFMLNFSFHSNEFIEGVFFTKISLLWSSIVFLRFR
uniref:Uncharacterized protein n=1 Tax=Anopheles dirus TaxID=7168 RepID=A0A182NYR6_9DIPT